MTKDLARNILTEHIRLMGDEPSLEEDREAMKYAISAIKQEPCKDAISREAVKNEIKCWIGSGEHRFAMSERFLYDRINNLPSVQPSREIKPKEEMTVEETISDLIWLLGSNLLDKGSEDTVSNAIYYLENQPSRKGHWILAENQESVDNENDNYQYYCSECNHADIHAKNTEVPYCWYCGAEMESADMRGDTE